MSKMTTEQLAKLFHDTSEALSNHSPKPWDDLPEERRRLLIATVSVIERVLLHSVESTTVDPQSMEYQRNVWQRRCGVLLSLMETLTKEGHLHEALLHRAYAVVNQNPYTKSFDDPHGDVARLTVQCTLDAAIAAGLVIPGTKWAPEPTQESEEETTGTVAKPGAVDPG